MSPGAQRIAIGEACGWEFRREFTNARGEPTKEWTKVGVGTSCVWDLPDYLNDLNAMHEAEKVLLKDVHLYLDYVSRLSKMVGGNYDAVFATAAQRAEAFMKTLGLWVEEAKADTKVA